MTRPPGVQPQDIVVLGVRWRQRTVLGSIVLAVAVLFSFVFTPFAFLPFVVLVLVAAFSVSQRNGVTAISVLLGATVLIPADRVIGVLGTVGVPGILVGGGLLLLWVYSRCGGTMGVDRGRQPVRLVAFLLLVSTLASYVAGQVRGLVPAEVSASDAALLGLASGLGILLFTSDAVRDMKDLNQVVDRLVTAAAFLALIALLQFYDVFDFAAQANFPGMIVNIEATENIFVIERGGLNRVAGTATHPIELSVVLAMTLPLALNRALFGPRGKRARNWALFCLIASIIPLTLSRSGILAASVGLLVYAMTLKFRTILNLMPLVLSGVAVSLVLAPGVLGMLWSFFMDTGSEPSSTARTDDYPVVYAQWLERPILGRGPGTYLPELQRILDNQYLLTLVSTGALGLLAFVALLCAGYSLARRARRSARDQEQRQLGQALAAAVAAAMAGSFTFDAMSFTMMFIVTYLVVGLAGALWRIAVCDREGPDGATHAGMGYVQETLDRRARLLSATARSEEGSNG